MAQTKLVAACPRRSEVSSRGQIRTTVEGLTPLETEDNTLTVFRRLRSMIRRAQGYRRTRVLAKYESFALLELAQRLRENEPTLAGKRLYERVAAERLGCDEWEARDVVRRATQDFAEWPVERPVNFRDLVSHLIIVHVATGQIDDARAVFRIVENVI